MEVGGGRNLSGFLPKDFSLVAVVGDEFLWRWKPRDGERGEDNGKIREKETSLMLRN